MAKKKAEDRTEKRVEAVSSGETTETPKQPETPAARSKPAPRAGSKPASPRPKAEPAAIREASEPRFQAILGEIQSVKQLVQQLAPRVAPGAPSARANGADAALESSVDSLRRLLSELIEQRMESVVQDLAEVRREAASVGGRNGTRIVARLDGLLKSLGAIPFEGELMDVVDPLIHAVAEERQQADAPAGVILETLRPGFRTARGMVVCKAAVAVNRRA